MFSVISRLYQALLGIYVKMPHWVLLLYVLEGGNFSLQLQIIMCEHSEQVYVCMCT